MDEDAAAEPVKVAADGGRQQQAFDDPRIPWTGKPGRADILCWAGIMLSGIFYWVILPFRASLVGTHPVFLVLLNGSTEGIVAAAAFARVGHGSLVVVLLAALVRADKVRSALLVGGPAVGRAGHRLVRRSAKPRSQVHEPGCSAGAASSPGPP